jgi:uncharacterized protein DUF6959
LLAAEHQRVIRTEEHSMSADDRATQLEMWSEQVNSAVVRVPGRRFPGVVIQGDSLSILFDLAMYVTEHLPRSADPELSGAAEELAEKLFHHVRNYESVLGARGVSLPYARNAGRVPRRVEPDGAAG